MSEMLLIDCVGYLTTVLNESTKNGLLKIRGKMQEANSVNKNKRLYTFEALSESVQKLRETITSRGLYGELDHPTDSVVHLVNASHIITNLYFEGQVLYGECEILPTPNGMILRRLIESGGQVGFSSRGVGTGTTRQSDGVLVIDAPQYKLITIDCVADPSTRGAFKESVIPRPVYEVQPEPVVENKNYINPRALVSYFGTLLEQRKEDKKEHFVTSKNGSLTSDKSGNLSWTNK